MLIPYSVQEKYYKWISEREKEDPYWADTEMDIRRKAVEVQELLRQKNSPQRLHVVTRLRPSPRGYYGFENDRIEVMLDPSLGNGVDALLLIEEILRGNV